MASGGVSLKPPVYPKSRVSTTTLGARNFPIPISIPTPNPGHTGSHLYFPSNSTQFECDKNNIEIGDQVIFASYIIEGDEFGQDEYIQVGPKRANGKFNMRIMTREERVRRGVGRFTDWPRFSPFNKKIVIDGKRYKTKYSTIGTVISRRPEYFVNCVYDIIWTNKFFPGVEIHTEHYPTQINLYFRPNKSNAIAETSNSAITALGGAAGTALAAESLVTGLTALRIDPAANLTGAEEKGGRRKHYRQVTRHKKRVNRKKTRSNKY